MGLLTTEIGFRRRRVKRTPQDKSRNEVTGEEVEAGRNNKRSDENRRYDTGMFVESKIADYIMRRTGMESSREPEKGQTTTDLVRTHKTSEKFLRKM
jgi:hypothetical protein